MGIRANRLWAMSLPFCGMIGGSASATTPEARAIAYLAREVPAWAAENRCHSCHNDGDGARALLDAIRRGRKVEASAVDETAGWLAKPEGWSKNGGDGPFSDKALAQVQFASTLAALVASGRSRARPALRRAADDLAKLQAADGSWPVDDDAIGSPTTYGKALATLSARDALLAADPEAHADRASKADAWFLRLDPTNTPDAAALAMAGAGHGGEMWADRRRVALAYLAKAQGPDGGWGPTAEAPTQAFDTALGVLAVASSGDPAEIRDQVRRARACLVATQEPDGGWPPTTRPAGGESYAQRVSTSAWATLALLATAPK